MGIELELYFISLCVILLVFASIFIQFLISHLANFGTGLLQYFWVIFEDDKERIYFHFSLSFSLIVNIFIKGETKVIQWENSKFIHLLLRRGNKKWYVTISLMSFEFMVVPEPEKQILSLLFTIFPENQVSTFFDFKIIL